MPRATRAAACVAILAMLLVACGGDPQTSVGPSPTPASPAPAGSPSPAGSGTAFPSPSASDSASPGATSAPMVELGVNSVARTVVDGLRLREEPGTAATSLGTLANGSPSFVVDGPVSADGYAWYLLGGLGIPQNSGCAGPLTTDPWECPVWFGWAASASPEGDPWLEQTSPDCPTWPEVVSTDISFGIGRIAYLACYGDEQRTLVGFYPEIPDDAGLGGACAEVPEAMSWIGCNLGYEHLVPDEATGFGFGFVFSVDPSVTMPDRGQWLEVTGRFDHPSAQECTYGDPPEESVMYCRAQFVVESVTTASAP